MNINFEKLPNVVFNWVEEFTFAELNDSQKKEVLTYFSEDEFDQMHQACMDLKSVATIDHADVFTQKKNALLHHFDEHHSLKRRSSFFPGAMVVWQAAAILLLLLSGWLFYQVFGLQKNATIQQIAVTDTVYVDRQVASVPEIIHDTIYRYKENKGDPGKNDPSSEDMIEPEDIESIGEMEIHSIRELENLNNSPKGNSMKDDSLLRKFTFVSM